MYIVYIIRIWIYIHTFRRKAYIIIVRWATAKSLKERQGSTVFLAGNNNSNADKNDYSDSDFVTAESFSVRNFDVYIVFLAVRSQSRFFMD